MPKTISLVEKLAIKSDDKVFLVNPPKNSPPEFANQAKAVDLADAVVVYASKTAHLDKLIPPIVEGLPPEARLWVCYPKPGKLNTDLGRDTLWTTMKSKGMEGVQLVSVDDTWSAFSFKRVA
jgi:hypothetical protein